MPTFREYHGPYNLSEWRFGAGKSDACTDITGEDHADQEVPSHQAGLAQRLPARYSQVVNSAKIAPPASSSICNPTTGGDSTIEPVL